MTIISKSDSGIISEFFLMLVLALVIVLTMPAVGEPVYIGKIRSWDFSFNLTTTYDDNILRYSDSDLDLMDDPTAPQNKYGIESKDDFIIIPEIDIVYKTRFTGHSLHLGFKTTYYYYVENDIKRHFRYQGRLRQYFQRGFYLQASLVYFPDYYYRNSYVSSQGYHEAKFDKIYGKFKLAVPIFDSFKSNLYYTYSIKDFNQLFDERDLTSHELEIEAIFRPVDYWKSWANYKFCTANSAGADNPDYPRDTSYDSFLFTLGLRFYLKSFSDKRMELAGRVSYKVVWFQTSKVTTEDSYRLGRKDDRWTMNISVKQKVVDNFSIGLNLKKVKNLVDLPASYLEKYLEYSSNSIYFILYYKL